jgi:hypothetical protein
VRCLVNGKSREDYDRQLIGRDMLQLLWCLIVPDRPVRQRVVPGDIVTDANDVSPGGLAFGFSARFFSQSSNGGLPLLNLLVSCWLLIATGALTVSFAMALFLPSTSAARPKIGVAH